jgi:hypothetical protein
VGRRRTIEPQIRNAGRATNGSPAFSAQTWIGHGMIDVCLDNEPASQPICPVFGLPMVGLGSLAVQRSIDL